MRNLISMCVILFTGTAPGSFAFTVPPSPSPAIRTQLQQGRFQTKREALLLEGAGAAVETFFQTQPYMSAFLTCSVKASAADYVAQKRQDEQDESSIDVSRNLAFLLYGGFYQGCAQHFIYNDLFPQWFGTDTTWQTVLSQVMADMIVFGPMVCLPIAYTVKSAFTSDELLGIRTFQNGLGKYFDDVYERFLLLRYWGVWFPVHCVTFAVVPAHLRIVFIAAVSFFWVVILSSVSGESDQAAQKPSTQNVPTARVSP